MERSRPYNLANASNFFLLVKVRVQLLVKKEQLNLNFKKKGIIGTDVLLAALRPNHLDRCSRLAGRMQLRGAQVAKSTKRVFDLLTLQRRRRATPRLYSTVRTSSRRPPVHRPNQTKSVSRVVAVGETRDEEALFGAA